MSPQVIREIVSVPEHPTVVRLDALGAKGTEWIEQSYCLTDDVKGHLTALRSAFGMDTGKGVFVIGPYGSGKSHLLAWIITRLEAGDFVPDGPAVSFVSLVNFGARMRLEDIVRDALGIEAETGDRRVAWAEVADRHPRGLVLILDELSEFLRSKPDPQSFNEDIRFLQFMGEWAAGRRFWVLGALQEGIERTGAIEHDLYRKIKDRYPLRLILSPSHIRELIADGVLTKQAGYEAAVGGVMERLRQAAPPGTRWDVDSLAAIYPLHPATLDLLDEVRDRFSQTRGAIDFAVTQLRGDAQRGISPFLDRPVGELLTPDVIIDHYSDLIAIQPEFLPISDKVFPYYRKNMDRLVKQAPLRAISWRLLKLLALAFLSRSRKGVTPAEATWWLGFSAIQIAPEKNLKIVADALERLASDGQFVKASREGYFLHTEEDAEGTFQRLLGHELSRMNEAEETLFETLAAILPERGVNPLALPRGVWLPRDVKWHGHDRRCHGFVDNEDPPASNGSRGNTLCIRLPWGDAKPSEAHHTVIPARVPLSDDVREAVACVRLLAKPVDPAVEKRARKVLDDRLANLSHEIAAAYHRARRLAPGVHGETAGGNTVHDTTEAWLADCFRWVLGRTYTAFERFAPAAGPLSFASYRAFFRFLERGDIEGRAEDPDVDLIREGYMVPMKLIKGAGREYRLPRDLERNELIKLVMPLLESDPEPIALYSYLADSLYGLVPDQIHVLLLFLLSQGEIDIIKGRRSISELYETLPTPNKYDRITKGSGLDGSAARALDLLCATLGARGPSQGTVVSQRQAAARASAQVATGAEPLSLLAMRLSDVSGSEALRKRIARLLDWSAAFTRSEDPLKGFSQLLYEAGAIERYIDELTALRGLPERIQRLIAERDRYVHLLASLPSDNLLDADSAVMVASLGPPPDLDVVEVLERWLADARNAYGHYTKVYAAVHDAYVSEIAAHPAWRFAPPDAAALRHAGLQETLSRYRMRRADAERQRCRGISNLSFSPVCACGFDGKQAPLGETLDSMSALQKEISEGIVAFFGQREVADKVRSFAEERQDRHPETAKYLAGQSIMPVIEDIAAFERHLAGLDTVRTIRLSELGRALAGQSWTKRRLFETMERLVGDRGDAPIRFEGGMMAGAPDQVTAWCVSQALQTGTPLPEGLPSRSVVEAVSALDPSGISQSALAALESLGLPDEGVDHVLRLLIGGAFPIRMPEERGPLVAALLDLLGSAEPDSVAAYAERMAVYYGLTPRMNRVAKEAWEAWLDRLADWPGLQGLPDVIDLLRAHGDATWVIVDALGIPLTTRFTAAIEDLLPSWRLDTVVFGRLRTESTTAGFYKALAEAGIKHSFEKIDCVDRVIHERQAPFQDIATLVAAELAMAFRERRPHLDRTRPLVVTADHGFRLTKDTKALSHGGASLLEATVPLFALTPRS